MSRGFSLFFGEEEGERDVESVERGGGTNEVS